MVASSTLAEFFKDPRTAAETLIQRYHIPVWLIVASELLTALHMREGVAALIVLGMNAVMLWLAVGFLKHRQIAVWFAVASELTAATQMTPDKASVVVLFVNAVLLALAVVVARFAGERKLQA